VATAPITQFIRSEHATASDIELPAWVSMNMIVNRPADNDGIIDRGEMEMRWYGHDDAPSPGAYSA